MEYLAWIVLGALIGMVAAQRKGFGTGYGLMAGALLGPFLAPLMFFAKSAGGPGSERRKCPSCDEWISSAAKVCPRCQRDIPQPAAPRPNPYAQPRR